MARNRVAMPSARRCMSDRGNGAVRVCAPQSRCQVRSEPTWVARISIHRPGQWSLRLRLKSGGVGCRNAELVVMSLSIVGCPDTSVPTVTGRLGIPVVSRETERHAHSPPRGVGVVFWGHHCVFVPRQIGGRRMLLQVGLTTAGPCRPQFIGHEQRMRESTRVPIPNTRDRWIHVKPTGR